MAVPLLYPKFNSLCCRICCLFAVVLTIEVQAHGQTLLPLVATKLALRELEKDSLKDPKVTDETIDRIQNSIRRFQDDKLSSDNDGRIDVSLLDSAVVVSKRLNADRTSLTDANVELIEEKKQLEAARDSLAGEKRDLEEQKTDLATRERLYGAGFLTSTVGLILTVFAAFIRYPLMRLERELKTLEVEEKRLELSRITHADHPAPTTGVADSQTT